MSNEKTTVLLIEDNPGDARLIRELLAEAGTSKFRAERADSLSAGLARIDQGDIDVVLSDLGLPDSQGLDTFARVHAQVPQMPIIVLTGLDDETIAVAAVRDGAQDYLVKGKVDGDSLARAIRYAIERNRVERALSESEQRFRSLIENASDLVLILNPDYTLAYVSPSVERILGHTVAAVVGARITDFIDPQDLPNFVAATEHRARTPGLSPFPMQVRVRHANGSWRILEGMGSNLLDQPGVRGLVMNARDITERKRAEERIQTHLQRLAALRAIDTAIIGSIDLQLTLNVVTEQTMSQLGADAVAVLLLNPHTQTLAYAAGCGFRGKAIERSRLRLGQGHAGRAALERHVVSIHNVRETGTGFIRADVLASEDFVCYHAAPLIAKGQVQGVLELFVRSHRDTEEDWIGFFEMLTQQAAIALDSAQLFDKLQRSIVDLSLAYDATIEGWSRALDLRDKETEGHTLRVAEMTERLARAMGISEAEIVHIRRGSLLHDIGKMGVPDGILLKPGKLTDEEWVQMIKHPQFAYDMLAPIAHLRPALDIPYCHHEKWDGTGYPRGFKGEQIPLAARVFAIVDVWDALTSDRPYRKAWTKERAREHIRAGSGSHFDPKVVKAFFDLPATEENYVME